MKNTLLLSILIFLFSQCKNEGETVRPQVEIPKPTSTISEAYAERPDMLHYVLLILEKEKGQKELYERKSDLADFNEKNSFLRKRMNNIYIGYGADKFPVIAIRRFQSQDEAKDYIGILEKNNFLKEGEKILPFSQDNYRRFLKNKNLEEYEAFYRLME